MKNKNTIMYCPLNDGHIVSEIQKFAQATFADKIPDFRALYGNVQLEGTNEFQNLICTLPVIDVISSSILAVDTIAVDYHHKDLLDDFWKKNHMELEKPIIPQSTDRELFFVVAALMQLKAFWDKNYKAKKDPYVIASDDSYTGETLPIDGYRLKEVFLALDTHHTGAVSASIDLDQEITLRLSDITAFGPKDLFVRDEKHLYDLITHTKLSYFYEGTLVAPCIEESLMVKNHLQGMHWLSKNPSDYTQGLYQVQVESSEALTKLKLNEKGVEARAETVAVGRMVFGCSANALPRSYLLTITHGLVVDIRYHNQSIFVAYVPQERFIHQ
jgi:hypothetical protein